MGDLPEGSRFEAAETDCLIGFDGYIDELFAVVSKRKGLEDYTRTEFIEEFGQRILSAAHRSADIEIMPLKTSFGGNAPIMAHALASLGYRTVCIGNMDCGLGEDPFLQMHPSCAKISTGQVNKTIALEFSDGKIMLGNLKGNHIGWEDIKHKAGIARLGKLVHSCRLIGMVNWSGMLRMNEIIRGFYQELLLPLEEERREGGEKKEVFLDLADPTARSEDDLRELFGLVRTMASTVQVTLGMNEKEAVRISQMMGLKESHLMKRGEAIRSALGLYQVVIHTHDFVTGCRAGQMERLANQRIDHPVSTTGAGDHFNAGFCMGLLEKKSLKECMESGQTVAFQYVSTGVV